MELIIALLVGGGCIALGRWVIRKGRRAAATETPAPAAPARGLEDLRPGDVVTHDRADYVVSGVARLAEATDSWIECRLEDAAREAWIVISARDPDAVVIGERVDDLDAGGHPSESIDHGGRVFQLERDGLATVETTGELGQDLGPGEWRYWNYRRPGDGRVWLRRVEERWSAFAGQRVRRHLIGFLPGS